MAKITILGWYGTETIGDRAILAGIIRLFHLSGCKNEYCIGSLFTLLTERTLLEDGDFLCKCAEDKNLNISIFNSFSLPKLKENIRHADLVIVGGGPLMDMSVMYLLEYSFKYAKKHGIKTALIGCGWGPLHQEEYIKCTLNIVKFSDIVIFRDKKSYDQCVASLTKISDDISYSVDPAFFAADYYKKNIGRASLKEGISVNFRDISLFDTDGNPHHVMNICVAIMNNIIQNNPDVPVKLVPMHTFYIGGDDRDFLLGVKKVLGSSENVDVVQVPQSLEQTMELYYDSLFCVGMRFHSIVLQTSLNGNNYIIDYTDANNGKIKNMLETVGLFQIYKQRYTSIFEDNYAKLNFRYQEVGTEIEIKPFMSDYIEVINKLNIK